MGKLSLLREQDVVSTKMSEVEIIGNCNKSSLLEHGSCCSAVRTNFVFHQQVHSPLICFDQGAIYFWTLFSCKKCRSFLLCSTLAFFIYKKP